MLYLIFFIVLVAALAFWISRKTRNPFPADKQTNDPPAETYVCDVCGEEGCTCHKEETPYK